uniref:Uncharacterized protein n=1 Tax=Daphnia magna TaxID=35525 RepID=A0A0P6G2E7_9CRUS
MPDVRLVVIAVLFLVGSEASNNQDFRTILFGHGHVGYRVMETVEPIRNKRDTTTANTTENNIFECYQFTWPGVTENNTVPDCARIRKFVPCFTPFVFTNDTSSPEPDPAIVKDYCDTRGCKVTCPKTSANSCIRYTYYSGEAVTQRILLSCKYFNVFLFSSQFEAGRAVNVTYFCGAVQDKTNDIPLKNGGFTDTLSGGLILGVKYCQGDLCNAASSVHVSLSFLFTLIAFLVFLC